MGSKDRFNPTNALMAIFDRHDGSINTATMQQYISFISFLSLYNVYQNMLPQASMSNDNLSNMLNQFIGNSEGPGNMNSLQSLLGNQEGIGSLLSSIPPDTLSKVTSMLGAGSGGAKKSNPLGGLLSMVSSNPSLLSMLGSGGGLASLLGGGGGGAGGLASLLGGGGGGAGGLASLLGGGKGGGLASLLGGSKGGGAAPLLSLLGNGGGKNLGKLLGGKGLGGIGGLTALAPMLPYVSSFTKSVGKKIKNKKSKGKSKAPQGANIDQLVAMLGKSQDYSSLAPHIAEMAKTGNINSALPILLPLMAKNSKKIKQGIKAGIKPLIKASGRKSNTKTTPPIDTKAPVKAPLKTSEQLKNESITKTGIIPKESVLMKTRMPGRFKNIVSTSYTPKIIRPK